MTPADIARQLELIASSDDFVQGSSQLVDEWVSEDGGVETVEPILEFIEAHPHVDFGSPGPLVHYAERFYGHGYEAVLLDSVRRKPTGVTAWMLNRVINGTKNPPTRQELIEAMNQVARHPLADDATRRMAQRFVERSG